MSIAKTSLDWLVLGSVLLVHLLVLPVRSDCGRQSITTVSGRSAPGDKLCPEQLIFEENFNGLDANSWRYEANLGGGGVSFTIRDEAVISLCKEVFVLYLIFKSVHEINHLSAPHNIIIATLIMLIQKMVCSL